MTNWPDDSLSPPSRLGTSILISLALHGMILWAWAAYRVTQEILRRSRPVEVDIVAPAPAPAAPPRPAVAAPPVPAPPSAAEPAPAPPPELFQKQIVSPSDSGLEKPPPPDTRLLSDRDNVVEQESVQVGEGRNQKPEPQPEAAPEPPPRRAAEPRRPEPPARRQPEPRKRPPDQVAALPKLDQLLPQAGDLAIASKPRGSAARRDEDSSAEGRRKVALPQSEAFSARPGIRDLLPGVKQSDITLLNTKAERFAPFVRRVAQRVFQHLDIRLRQAVSGVTQGGKEFAIVEAVMSKEGRLMTARVIERDSTSSLSADRALLSAAEPDIFFDENPPAGAEASDGNIHFKLLIELEVVAYDDPRSGRVRAGYHGVAAVGLD